MTKSFKTRLIPSFLSFLQQTSEGRGPILLVPELCLMTGLSEDMRSNFTIMKDIGVHTRVMPGDRTRELQKFLNQINK